MKTRAVIRRERDKPRTRKVGPLPYIFADDKEEFEVDAEDVTFLLHHGNFKEVVSPKARGDIEVLEKAQYQSPPVTNDEFVSDVPSETEMESNLDDQEVSK